MAIGITGKPFILAAGADLTGVPKVRDRADAWAISHIGHRVMRKLRDGGTPIVLLRERCGARRRTRARAALRLPDRAVVRARHRVPRGLPRPGPRLGGAFLLPQLIGPEAAVTVIVDNALNQNTMLTGVRAFELGIADAMFGGADFLEQSLRWAAGVLTGEVEVRRTEPDRGAVWHQTVESARQRVEARLHGAAPAAPRALDLIDRAVDGDRDRGFADEDEALADLIMSPELARVSTRSTWCRSGLAGRSVRPTSRWPARSRWSGSSAPG